MLCPRCVQSIHRAAESCPHCGFQAEDADKEFGEEDVVLDKFTDHAGLLRSKERVQVRLRLKEFERRFPQLFFAIYVGAFKKTPDMRQFGFWMLNRAAYRDVDLGRPNACGILLLIDANGKGAGFTYGYALHPYLSEELTFQILSAAHPYFLEGEHLKALMVATDKLEAILKKGSKRAQKNPESVLANGGQIQKVAGEGLKTIREDHRESDAKDKELEEEKDEDEGEGLEEEKDQEKKVNS